MPCRPAPTRSAVTVLTACLLLAGVGVCGLGTVDGQPASPLADDVRSLVSRVDSLAAEVALKAGDARGAARRLDELVQARARLIAAAPSDVRLATWLLDQGESVLERASLDGSAWSVLAGVPAPEQAGRVHAAAAEALRLARRADEAIDSAITILEDRLFAARGGGAEAVQAVAGEAEAAIARLVDVERGVRAPLLRGRAGVLGALAGDWLAPGVPAAARAAPLDEAIDAIGPLSIVVDADERSGDAAGPAMRAEVVRRVSLAAALLARGDRESVRLARTTVQWVRDREGGPARDDPGEGPGATASGPPASENAALAACLLALSTAEPEKAAEVARSLLVRCNEELGPAFGGAIRAAAASPGDHASARRALLYAECAARVLLRAAPAGRRTGDRSGEALSGLERCLAARDDDEWRRLVYAKMAAVIGPNAATGALTPHGAMAAALRMIGAASEESLAPAAAASRRQEALVALRVLIERADAREVRGEALWEAASLVLRPARRDGLVPEADRREALELLARLVEEHPEFKRAGEALEAAAALCLTGASSLNDERGGGDGREASASDAADADPRVRVLSRAVDARPPLATARACELELARRLASRWLADAAGRAEGELSVDEVVRAVGLLRQAAGAASTADGPPNEVAASADATARGVLSAVLTPPTLRRLGPRAKIALSESVMAWAGERDARWTPVCRVPRAEAWAENGEAGAVAELTELDHLAASASASTAGGVDGVLRRGAPRVRLWLGIAQRREGLTTAAFGTLRRLADELDRAPTPDELPAREVGIAVRPHEFWCVWAELIEMLDASDTAGDRAPTLRLHLNRLRTLDPSLGGGPCGARLRVVLDRLEQLDK